MDTRKEELEVLLEFSRIASTAGTVSDLVQAMRVTVTEGFGYDRVSVYVADPEDDRRMCEAGSLNDSGECDSDTCWSMDSQPELAKMLSYKQDCIWSSDISRVSSSPLVSSNPPAPAILIPLRTPQRLVGWIAIDNSVSGHLINEVEGRALQSFARQAAANLQNVSLVEDRTGKYDQGVVRCTGQFIAVADRTSGQTNWNAPPVTFRVAARFQRERFELRGEHQRERIRPSDEQ